MKYKVSEEFTGLKLPHNLKECFDFVPSKTDIPGEKIVGELRPKKLYNVIYNGKHNLEYLILLKTYRNLFYRTNHHVPRPGVGWNSRENIIDLSNDLYSRRSPVYSPINSRLNPYSKANCDNLYNNFVNIFNMSYENNATILNLAADGIRNPEINEFLNNFSITNTEPYSICPNIEKPIQVLKSNMSAIQEIKKVFELSKFINFEKEKIKPSDTFIADNPIIINEDLSRIIFRSFIMAEKQQQQKPISRERAIRKEGQKVIERTKSVVFHYDEPNTAATGGNRRKT